MSTVRATKPKRDRRRSSLLLDDQLAWAAATGFHMATGYLCADSHIWVQTRIKGDTFTLDLQGLTEDEMQAVLDVLRKRTT